MESDHLEEAERFLRSALHQDADVGRVSRHDLESAFYHVQEARKKLAPKYSGDIDGR